MNSKRIRNINPAIAQLAEHLTVDCCSYQMVPGSIPGRRILMYHDPCALMCCIPRSGSYRVHLCRVCVHLCGLGVVLYCVGLWCVVAWLLRRGLSALQTCNVLHVHLCVDVFTAVFETGAFNIGRRPTF